MSGRGTRVQAVLDLRDDLPGAERRVTIRETELGGRQPARAASASTTSARSRIAAQSDPYAPAFIRTPPPAVPGIAQANSRPPSPAPRARCRQTAFVAPPPAMQALALHPHLRQLPASRSDESRDAGVRRQRRWSRARPPRRSIPLPGRQTERLLELRSASRAARSGTRGPPVPMVVQREWARAPRRRPSRRQAVHDRAGDLPRLPHAERHDDVTGPRHVQRQRGRVVQRRRPARAHVRREALEHPATRDAVTGPSRAPVTSVTTAASAPPERVGQLLGEMPRAFVDVRLIDGDQLAACALRAVSSVTRSSVGLWP